MRILLIEDEPRIRAFLARGLRVEGFAVDECADGESGLQRALAEDYDLVVLDLLLPKCDGLSVLEKLHEERAALPVLILSARSDLRTKLRGFAVGASDYVAKPFAFAELLARVRVQIRQRNGNGNGGGETVLHVGRLVLDLGRHEVALDGRTIELTTGEMRLLHHLVARAGQVVSREELLAGVWGYHFDPQSNVVDVCIRRLRKKLGPDSPIETVRNAGYRLSAA